MVVALIAASGAIGQWRNYLLFTERRLLHGPEPQRSPVPQERRLLRLQAPLPVLPRPVGLRLARGHGRDRRHRPLPERRHPRAVGVPQRGPPGQGPPLGPPGLHGPGEGGRVRPGPLQPRPLPERLRPGRRLHRRARPPTRPHTAHLDLAAGGGDPAHQHPPAGLGAARPGRGAVGLRGHRRGRHLPGHRPGGEGDAGAEHPRAALHRPQHRRHPFGAWASTT